jgi:uncharacterized protein YcbX
MKTVSKIIIYPIKSLPGISLSSAELTPFGFKNDRAFMLVDTKEQKMITLRNFPVLYKIKISSDTEDLLLLENEQLPHPLYLKLTEINNDHDSQINQIQVWDDLVEVQSWNEEANQWFSDFLGINCALVKMAPNFLRQVDRRYAAEGQGVLFSDGFPYLICTESSLSLLNQDLSKKVSIDHFRPNIVLDGGTPNEELNWDFITIKNHIFNSFKPCARCQVISIDPKNTNLNEEILPLMAKKYQKDNKIIFGINACWKQSELMNHLSVGDICQTTNKRNP